MGDLHHGSSLLSAFAVLAVSFVSVLFLTAAFLGTMDRAVTPSLLDLVVVMIAPVFINSGVAFAVGRRWQRNPALLGLIAALPFVCISGLLLLQSRSDGVMFWTTGGLITCAVYVGVLHWQRQ